MNGLPEQYCFEGEALTTCTRCGLHHTIYFSGAYPMGIQEAMEEALLADGWGVASMTCPDCYDPLDEQKARDEEIEEWLDLEEDMEDEDWEMEEE